MNAEHLKMISKRGLGLSGIIYGPPGSGKTTIAKSLVEDTPGAQLCESPTIEGFFDALIPAIEDVLPTRTWSKDLSLYEITQICNLDKPVLWENGHELPPESQAAIIRAAFDRFCRSNDIAINANLLALDTLTNHPQNSDQGLSEIEYRRIQRFFLEKTHQLWEFLVFSPEMPAPPKFLLKLWSMSANPLIRNLKHMMVDNAHHFDPVISSVIAKQDDTRFLFFSDPLLAKRAKTHAKMFGAPYTFPKLDGLARLSEVRRYGIQNTEFVRAASIIAGVQMAMFPNETSVSQVDRLEDPDSADLIVCLTEMDYAIKVAQLVEEGKDFRLYAPARIKRFISAIADGLNGQPTTYADTFAPFVFSEKELKVAAQKFQHPAWEQAAVIASTNAHFFDEAVFNLEYGEALLPKQGVPKIALASDCLNLEADRVHVFSTYRTPPIGEAAKTLLFADLAYAFSRAKSTLDIWGVDMSICSALFSSVTAEAHAPEAANSHWEEEYATH